MKKIRDFENYDTSSDFIADGKTPPYYDSCIEFDNGQRMLGASCDADMLEKFNPLGMELMNYMDEYIESKAENQ